MCITGNFLKAPSALPQEASTVCALRFFEALVSKAFPCCVPLHRSPVAQVWGRTSTKAGRDLVPLVSPALLALLGGPLGKWGRGKKQSPVPAPPSLLQRYGSASLAKAAETKRRTGQRATTLAMCSGARLSWHGVPEPALGRSCVALSKQFPSLNPFQL